MPVLVLDDSGLQQRFCQQVRAATAPLGAKPQHPLKAYHNTLQYRTLLPPPRTPLAHCWQIHALVSLVLSRCHALQCSKFHALEEFDDERHSCRASLQRHQLRRQRRRQRRAEEQAQKPQPKRKRGAVATGQEADAAEEEWEAVQRRPHPPSSGKRQRSSKGSRQPAQQVQPKRGSRKQQLPPKPVAPQRGRAPTQQRQLAQQALAQPLAEPLLAQQPAPLQQTQQTPPLARQLLQQAGQRAVASSHGPASPSLEARLLVPMSQGAAASSSQHAAAAAPASASAAWHDPTSQLDWDALLSGPAIAPLPVPSFGRAKDPCVSSSHGLSTLSAIDAAELEELCQIETPLFPEWERPQPAAAALASSAQPPAEVPCQPAAATLASSRQPQVGIPLLPSAPPASRSQSLPSQPVPWPGSMQPFVITSPSAPAAHLPAAQLPSASPTGQQAGLPPLLPGGPYLAAMPQLPQPPWQQAWQQAPPHECELHAQQQSWQAAWLQHQLSAATSAACSTVNAPHALPAAAAAAGGPPASGPPNAWQSALVRLQW